MICWKTHTLFQSFSNVPTEEPLWADENKAVFQKEPVVYYEGPAASIN